MIFHKLTASFGKLEGETLDLQSGLNIVYAPNEGGKSTWCAFLRTMLYGIDTRDRDKKGYLADKNLYAPWSGAPMEGAVELTWGGRDLTLRRGPRNGVPFAHFSASYTQSGAPVPALTGEDCGPTLVGVGREVYTRSAFIGGGSLPLTSTPELEQRMAALITTGEEGVPFSQAEGQLKEWLRRRRHNNTGIIPRLESQLGEVTALLGQLAQVTGEIAALSAQRVALSERCQVLEGEMALHRQWETYETNLQYTRATQALSQAQAQLDDLLAQGTGERPSQERLRHWQGELAILKSLERDLRQGAEELTQATQALEEARIAGEEPRFAGLSGADALALCQRETARYQGLVDDLRRSVHRPALAFCLGLLSAAALAGAVALQYLPLPMGGGIGAAVLLLGSGLALHLARRRRSVEASRNSLLATYQMDDIQSLLPLAQSYQARQQVVEDGERDLRQRQSAQERTGQRVAQVQADLLDFVHSFSPEIQGLLGCSAALSRALRQGEEEAVATANLAGAQRLLAALPQGELLTQEGAPPRPSQPIHQTAAQLSAAQEELRRVEDGVHLATGRQRALGDPAFLAGQEEELRHQLERRNGEYTAISTALQALQTANARLEERFSPQLNQLAGDYLHALTGGQYTALSLNRSLEGEATGADGILPRSALALSRGTADQLYLAARLAIAQLCLPQAEPVPLVLDDALAAFDEGRMALCLDRLCQLAQGQQIILFTCQRREGDYLKGRENVSIHTL